MARRHAGARPHLPLGTGGERDRNAGWDDSARAGRQHDWCGHRDRGHEVEARRAFALIGGQRQIGCMGKPHHLERDPAHGVGRPSAAAMRPTSAAATASFDCAVFAAAVADWRVAEIGREKIKKASAAPALALVENPDILADIAHRTDKRPQLVIGFAAETQKVIANAKEKLKRKGCDWILANDVSAETGVMGGDCNRVHLITADGVESWPPQSKDAVAAALVGRIAAALGRPTP